LSETGPELGLVVASAELPASELIAVIPLEPDQQASLGELWATGKPKKRSSLRYDAPHGENLGEMLTALLDRLEPYFPDLRRAAEDPRIEIYLWVGIFMDRDNEEHWLTGADIARLAQLGARVRVGLDVYCICEDADQTDE
jgi:Domain of unknown function (DUF4279)